VNTTWRVLVGDVRDKLAELPAGSVQCCVTSPPYFGLRDYGVAGQIGLERTPAEFVSEMVNLFRLVREAMREDGTLWLNLGDSYAGYWGDKKARDEGRASSADTNGWTNGFNMNARPQFDHLRGAGLKPKDLIGIPWRVALALQQPYYAGTIKHVEDRVWLAAMLDAEGCLFIHKRKAGQHNGQGYYRQNDNFAPGVEICNTSLAVVERIHQIVGKGSICTSEKGRHGRKQTLYRWNLRTTESREFVRELYPHLIAKRQQARLLCGCPSSGEQAEAAHAALIGLHNGIESDVDAPAPTSLFTPGWYLRSDVIWAKSNPMPESVTDRPTKSHEYVFLLTKAERYYYDAEAIAEEGIKPAGANGSFGNKDAAARRVSELTGNMRNGVEYLVNGKRNARSVWTINTAPYPEAHFATFPEALPERCIKAGSKEGDTVLDPFCGSGTTGAVSMRLGRHFVGIELNPAYAELSRKRIGSALPMFSQEVPA
jgi:DNA modification methylase